MGLFNFVKDAGEKLWDAVTGQHDKDDQDADYRCGHNKFIHQIIYVMKMKIDRKRDVERINRFAVNQRANR